MGNNHHENMGPWEGGEIFSWEGMEGVVEQLLRNIGRECWDVCWEMEGGGGGTAGVSVHVKIICLILCFLLRT